MMRGNKNALFNGRMEIHNYQRRLQYWQQRIGKEKHADKAVAFISHLKTKGLSDGRVCAYASRLPRLQRTLAEMSVVPQKIDSIKAENILAELLKDWMKGSTKQQYALLLKKFVNYVKTGNSDKNCNAVSWIKPSRYNKGRAVTVEASDLLSEEEILALLSAVTSVSKRVPHTPVGESHPVHQLQCSNPLKAKRKLSLGEPCESALQKRESIKDISDTVRHCIYSEYIMCVLSFRKPIDEINIDSTPRPKVGICDQDKNYSI